MRSILSASLLLSTHVLVSCSSAPHITAAPRSIRSHAPLTLRVWGSLLVSRKQNKAVLRGLTNFPRGGSSEVEEEDSEYDRDDEKEGEESDRDHASESDDDGDDESEVLLDGVEIDAKVEKFDEPLVASPMTNLYASFGVILLSKKIDLFHPTIVKIARFAFIAYLVLLQFFLLYVRVQAKLNNDRTPIELKNPLTAVLQSQLGGGRNGDGNNMMKKLASSFMSSKSTAMDYDLKQARSMQSGLVFNMLFMWFLHFKMEQVQPLLIQTANGIISMVYSPLFQVYVLGKNLERPFKNVAMQKMEDAAVSQRQTQTEELAAEQGNKEAGNDGDEGAASSPPSDENEEYFSADEEEDESDDTPGDEAAESDGFVDGESDVSDSDEHSIEEDK